MVKVKMWAKKPLKDLKPGQLYRITHYRKGEFIAELLGEQRDTVHVAIDTSEGAGHERLANVRVRDEEGKKTTPAVTEKLLLKSLIVSMETVNGRN